VAGEENIERLQSLDQALGIVEPVDADDEGAPVEASDQVLDERRADIAARETLEIARLDTDPKTADPRLLAVERDGDVVTRGFEHP
jgi:hypothetical protein